MHLFIVLHILQKCRNYGNNAVSKWRLFWLLSNLTRKEQRRPLILISQNIFDLYIGYFNCQFTTEK